MTASTLYGVDSSQPPTLAQAKAAAAAGVKWWGGYVGGSWHPVAWPAPAWAALKSAGITPVPIWVPRLWQDDPVKAAREAMAAVKQAGLGTTEVVLDTEAEEEQQMSPSQVKAWVDAWNRTLTQAGWTSVVYDGAYNYHGSATEWLPSWNGSPTAASGSAHQYQGNTSRWGMAVDLDVAASGFALTAAKKTKTRKTRNKTTSTRLVVSPPELLQMADDLVDARLHVAGIHKKVESLAGELAALRSERLAGAAGQVQRALALLSGIDSGTDGLGFVRGAIFQAEMVARRTRKQALRADAVSKTSKPKPTTSNPKTTTPKTPTPKTRPQSGSGTTVLA